MLAVAFLHLARILTSSHFLVFRRNYDDAYDTYLVLSFVGETRVLGMNAEDELDEADIPGFDSSAQVSELF